MKSASKLFWGLAIFYLIDAIVYASWTIAAGGLEWAGSVILIICVLFSGFLAFYLGVENRPFVQRLLPEDRLDGEIEEADADLGFFAPHSIWPVFLAAVLGLVMVGVSNGFWPVFFFAPLGVIGLVGWALEFYRGRFGH